MCKCVYIFKNGFCALLSNCMYWAWCLSTFCFKWTPLTMHRDASRTLLPLSRYKGLVIIEKLHIFFSSWPSKKMLYNGYFDFCFCNVIFMDLWEGGMGYKRLGTWKVVSVYIISIFLQMLHWIALYKLHNEQTFVQICSFCTVLHAKLQPALDIEENQVYWFRISQASCLPKDYGNAIWSLFSSKLKAWQATSVALSTFTVNLTCLCWVQQTP